MGDVINLNKARKAKRRAEEQVQAAANRVRFGRTKVEREAEAKVADKAERDLDGTKRDDRT